MPPTDTNPATPHAIIAPVTIADIDCSIASFVYRFMNLKYIRSPGRVNLGTEMRVA